MCDQVDQVVPAHQVDDIDEAHLVDPVHHVDHKDEFTCSMMTRSSFNHAQSFFEHGVDHFGIISG